MTNYAELYNDYWSRSERWGSHSFVNADVVADQILSLCGGGSLLDVGCGMGLLVRTLLRRGIDAHGLDVADRPIAHLNPSAPGRFHVGSMLALPFPDGAFDTLVCTDALEHLAEEDVPAALAEFYRVARRHVYLMVATTPDRDRTWHLTVRNRPWWENAALNAGFRKHRLSQLITPYESLERETSSIIIALERIAPALLERYPLAALEPERDLHMDMLRETGRRADAHVARYLTAATFVRPGDVVLDAACGLGYGSAILAANSGVGRVIGLDASRSAIEYANANYGEPEMEFVERDLVDLSFLPDHSIDYVVSVETLEHLPHPEAFLAEVRRILRPSGRLFASVPNEWVDESGRDPNPHHLHVYTWPKLREQVERHFIPERLYAQTAGGSIKLGDHPRRLHQVPLSEADRAAAEWWLVLAMKSPLGFDKSGYCETSFPDHGNLPEYNISAFGRDYDNPWLVKGMVSIGMRVVDDEALARLSRDVLEQSRFGSADSGAALCIQGYRLLEMSAPSAGQVTDLLKEFERYHAQADDNPTAWRWRISNEYLAGRLLLAVGRLEDAREAFLRCGSMDFMKFSPLLATKTVDALYQAGMLAAGQGDLPAAAAHLRAAMREARRAVSGDWTNIWGRLEDVVEFGLPEATDVLDLATRCSYGLVALKRWASRPGWAWSQAGRNKARDLACLRRRLQLAEQTVALQMLKRPVRMEAVRSAASGRKEVSAEERIQELQAHLDDLHEWTETLDRSHQDQAIHITALTQHLETITNSTGWAFLQLCYRLRFWAVPRGSHRERAARWVMHKLRRARFHAGQGPRAFVRASAAWAGRLFQGQWFISRTFFGGLAAAGDRSRWKAAALSAPGLVRTGGELSGLVSVILPVYNQADMLRDSIESVLAQTYPDFELIIINDGSHDEVERVLDQYVAHPRIRLLNQENQKLPRALSNAFDFARGEFWTWTSGDNLMEPTQLQRQVEFLRSQPDVAMVYCDYMAIDDRGEPLQDSGFRSQNRRARDLGAVRLPRDVSALNRVPDNFIGACFMYRGWVGRLLGDYTPSLGVEDYDYWMRMNNLFAIRHIGTDELLYRYRVHGNTLNAQAQTHHIYERVNQLLDYEKDRRWYFDQPWMIVVDEVTEQLLSGVKFETNTLERLKNLDSLANVSRKLLMLVSAKSLPKLVDRGRPPECCVAAWFAGDEREPFRYAGEIQALTDLCFAADEATAERLALFSPWTFQVGSGQQLLEVATAFANNKLFGEKSVPAEDWLRILPEVYYPVPGRGVVPSPAKARGPATPPRPGTGDTQMSGRRINVLFQVQNFTQGGLEQVILDVASILDPDRTAAGHRTTAGHRTAAGHRFNIFILVLGDEGAAAEKARQRGLTLLRLGGMNAEASYRKLLREKRIDVINAHYSLFGAAIAHDMGIPFLQTIHNSYVWLSAEDIQQHRQADAYTSGYMCVSNMVAAYAHLRIGLPADKMLVVPNGIDTDAMDAARASLNRNKGRAELGYGRDDFVFLCTASIAEVKAQLPLVQAVAEAVKRDPRIRLAVLGRPQDPIWSEEYFRKVREEVARLGIGRVVQFLGYHPDPQKFYYLADAFVLPSFVEGWSLALAEAIYAGLPIIASDVGSAREILSRTGGHVLDLPFGSLIDTDGERFYRAIRAHHPDYVRRISEAMVETAAKPQPPVLTDGMRESFRRSVAFQTYPMLFAWLAGGGSPAGLRTWQLTRLHTCERGATHILPPAGSSSASRDLLPAFRGVLRTADAVMPRLRNSRGAVVFPRSIHWSNWLFQRPHQLARYFARRGYTVVYDDSGRFTGFVGFKEIEQNLFLFRGPKDQLHCLPEPILWTFCYNFQLRDGFPENAAVVYDVIDDFAVHPFDRKLLEDNHRRALREATMVAYVARHLESLLQKRPDRMYLPNGVEADFFANGNVRLPHDPRIRDIIARGRPIAGYYGALAEWFDYELLEQIARRRPDWSFVLIGPKYDLSLENKPALRLPNVDWLGPRDYAGLPAYLRCFDVAMIPFQINDITLATSPLKLYEYFAAGKPVITTPMPECMAFPEVRIVRSTEEFSEALDVAREQADDSRFVDRLRRLGCDNSWAQRVLTVEAGLAAASVGGL